MLMVITGFLLLLIYSYLTVLVIEALARYHRKDWGLPVTLSTLALSLFLYLTTWLHFRDRASWHLAVFALVFMVLGVLPQVEEFRKHEKLSLVRHVFQFLFHILIIFLLYSLMQV